MSDSTLSLVQPTSSAITATTHAATTLQATRPPANGRPATPTSESVDEVSIHYLLLTKKLRN